MVLTHLLAHDPGLGFGVDLDQNCGGTNQQDHHVSHTQVHQEDVGRIAHVLGLQDHDGDHDVAGDSYPQDHGAEDHGRDPDVSRDHRKLIPCGVVPHPLDPREVGVQIGCRNDAVVCPKSSSIGSCYGNRRGPRAGLKLQRGTSLTVLQSYPFSDALSPWDYGSF